MPWLEWCPDPQQPDAQWIKIIHPGAWTPQDERDDPPPRHTYRGLPAPDDGFNSMFSPDQHNVATQSSALCMSTQMLDAILRSSDASAFSTENITRLQAGICQQHQPVRTSRSADPLESTGVADPYLPASQPNSSDVKEKPIFELDAE